MRLYHMDRAYFVFVLGIFVLCSTDVDTKRTRRQTSCEEKYSSLHPDHTMCLQDIDDVTEVTLTDQDKQDIVDKHNFHRANVPGAVGIMSVVWDDDIAVVAAKWARQCKNGHEKDPAQRNVPSLPGVGMGQNVASGWDSFTRLITDGWHNEVNWFKFGQGSINGSAISHYTQMTNERVSRIGCGRATCVVRSRNTDFFVCNYARGQRFNEAAKPYCLESDSSTTCTGCLKKTSTGLCDCDGKICMNSGKLDYSTCECECPSSGFFTGASCQKLTCPSSDRSFCRDASSCSRFGNFPYDCPNLCGTCPAACDLVCENGGTQNTLPCLCTCTSGWKGDTCQTPASQDGTFGQWSEWDTPPCPVTCGLSAFKMLTRKRSCLDGECTGVSEETKQETCGLSVSCSVSGEWGEWSILSCAQSCGDSSAPGVSRRTRDCGLSCTQEETKTIDCRLQPCAVDGGYTEWTPWYNGTCTVTCGLYETRYIARTRSCTSPSPQHGGANCTGARYETRTGNCHLKACPVDGGVTEWGEWTDPPCPVSCGVTPRKNVTRSRTCSDPSPQHGGQNCTEPLQQTQQVDCDVGLCPAVDGGVTSWTEWDDPVCPVTCGEGEERVSTRSRSCTAPSPQHGGQDCSEPLVQTRALSCDIQPCSVDGGVSEWEPWTSLPCDVTCSSAATKTRTRIRTCSDPFPAHGGAKCNETLSDTEIVSCELDECPIDGGISAWTEWSDPPCTSTCGFSARKIVRRTRSCTDPPPQYGGRDCAETTSETAIVNCLIDGCAGSVDGGVTQWTTWTDPPCSVTCGVGVVRNVTRTRTCTNPSPKHGGRECTDPLLEWESRECSIKPCPVDGGLSQWLKWSDPECTSTCGKSISVSVRVRTCSNPEPQNGGRNCTGSRFETRTEECQLRTCPVDGGFSKWSEWNEAVCAVTCGKSTPQIVTRSRSCSNPLPANGGRNCSGFMLETKQTTCQLPLCPVSESDLTYLIIGVSVGVGVSLIVIVVVIVLVVCLFRRYSRSAPVRETKFQEDIWRNPYTPDNRSDNTYVGARRVYTVPTEQEHRV